MPAKDHSLDKNTQQLLDEAEAMIWGLLDENIEAVDTGRLEQLMSNEEVRQRYIQCVELHNDLQQLLGDQNKTKPSTPVLGSLGDMSSLYPGTPAANILPPLGP